MQRQILFNVQMLRFLAAASILFSHAGTLLLAPDSFLWRLPWTGGVDIFFVISGFIMAWMTRGQFGDREAASNFLLRRIIRVVPPYWFFTMLAVAAVYAAGGQIRNTTASWQQILSSLAFLPWPRPDGAWVPILPQGWTLIYELFFYAAFAVSMLFRRAQLFLVAAFVALAAVHAYVPPQWFVLAFDSDPIILEFLAGIALAHVYLTGTRLPAWASALLIAMAVLWFTQTVTMDLGDFTRPVSSGIPAALIVTALVLRPEPKHRGPLRRVLQAGGDASYTLYLSHLFTVEAVIMLCSAAGLRSPWLVCAIAMAAAIAAAVLFFRIVEAPFTAFLGRRLHARISGGLATVAP